MEIGADADDVVATAAKEVDSDDDAVLGNADDDDGDDGDGCGAS